MLHKIHKNIFLPLKNQNKSYFPMDFFERSTMGDFSHNSHLNTKLWPSFHQSLPIGLLSEKFNQTLDSLSKCPYMRALNLSQRTTESIKCTNYELQYNLEINKPLGLFSRLAGKIKYQAPMFLPVLRKKVKANLFIILLVRMLNEYFTVKWGYQQCSIWLMLSPPQTFEVHKFLRRQ